MAVTVKSFADGQLAVAKATLYSATGQVVAEVTYVNTGLLATCNLYYLRSGGTSRRIIPENLPLAANGGMMTCAKVGMSLGDALEGDASLATQVDYVIEGIVE